MKKTTSSNFINTQYLISECEVNYALSVISGRWKLQILLLMVEGTNRFSKIQEALPNISHQVLGRQIRQLEQDCLIVREERDETPKRIDYYLTDKAKALVPVIEQLCHWGKGNMPACVREKSMAAYPQ